MRSSSEPRRTTQPLTNTQPLAHTTRKLADEPISSTISQLRPSNLPVTTGRVPIVIPASEKRQRHAPQPPPPRRRRPILVLGLLLGSVVMLIATALFVIPLDNGQPPINGLQAFGNWITTGQFGVINPSQHTNPPTPTPALLTGEATVVAVILGGHAQLPSLPEVSWEQSNCNGQSWEQRLHSILGTANISSGVAVGNHIVALTWLLLMALP